MADNESDPDYANVPPPAEETVTSDDSDIDDEEPAYDNATLQPVEHIQAETGCDYTNSVSSFCRNYWNSRYPISHCDALRIKVVTEVAARLRHSKTPGGFILYSLSSR